jgi:hypothetical protein
VAGVVREQAASLAGAFGRGFNAALGRYDEPGPAPKISPFEAGTVTPGAVALKSLAALISGRRGAANARADRETNAGNAAYRALQMKALDAKVNPPVVPTRRLAVPGTGQEVDATEADIMNHPGAFRTPASEAPNKRMSVPTSYDDLIPSLRSYDPETHTAESSEVSAAATRRAQREMGNRFDKTFGQRGDFHADSEAHRTNAEERTTASDMFVRAKDHIAALTKNEDEVAADAESRGLNTASEWARALQDPNAPPGNKAKAARYLGIRPQMFQQDINKPGMVPLTDAAGNILYDTKDLAGAVTRYAKKFAAQKRAQITATHSGERLFYDQMQQNAAGMYRGPGQTAPAAGDSVGDAIRELSRMYTVAPADSIGIDIPAP